MVSSLLTSEEIAAIARHQNEMPQAVALRLKAGDNLRPQVVATQVDCRQRLRAKVPAWLGVQGLYVPSALATQQCSSEAVARWRASLVCGDSLVDLTGGLGVDCFFMSRKIANAIHVEANADLQVAVRHNFALLGADNVTFVNETAEAFLQHDNNDRVGTIFIDPSRRSNAGSRVFQLADCSPNVTAIAPQMLSLADVVLIKLSSLLDISQVVRALPCVTDVYVVGVDGECKDLMVRMQAGSAAETEVCIHAVMLVGGSSEPVYTLTFTTAQEQIAKSEPVQQICEGGFLFEPSSVIMKAGCYRTLAQQYNVRPVANTSHLYVSDQDVCDFPGRRFRIKGVFDMSKQSLKKLKALCDGASVAVRNFYISADELRKRLKVREDDKMFIFGTRLADGSSALILCERIFS